MNDPPRQPPSCYTCGKQLSKRIGNDNKHVNIHRIPEIYYFCSREHKMDWVQNYKKPRGNKKNVK